MSQLGGSYSTALEELVDDYNVYGAGGADVVSQMGYGCKLILDGQDNPAIVYVGTPDQDGQGEDRTSLRMARKEGDQWLVEIIEILEEWKVESLSAAIATDGTIGVAYFMEELDDTSYPDHLRYAYRQPDGEWVIDIVDISSHCGDYPSLAFDANSRPVIAYYDIHANTGSYRPREDLKLARFENDRWEKRPSHPPVILENTTRSGSTQTVLSISVHTSIIINKSFCLKNSRNNDRMGPITAVAR